MKFILLILCSLVVLPVYAQNNFVEGEIIYSVIVRQANAESKGINKEGQLKIKLKAAAVVKELTLKGEEFANTILYSGIYRPNYSIRMINGKGFAVQLDTNLVNRKLANCQKLNIEPLLSDIKTIHNFNTEKATLSCNNAKPIILYFTKEWKINHPLLFEDFPSFTYLPLKFTINKEDGSTIQFELVSIESKPMDNRTFDVPNGYNIISQEEYQSWQH